MEQFVAWLESEKGLQQRSARDVKARLKRAQNFINEKEISADAIIKLEKSNDFQKLTTSVKSQLRRSLNLYLEYMNKTE